MWGVDIFEGKRMPKESGTRLFRDNHSKTGSVLFRIFKPTFRSDKIIILDLVFCLLQAIVSLMAHGVNSSDLMRRKCWSKHVNRDNVKEHYAVNHVRFQEVLPGI